MKPRIQRSVSYIADKERKISELYDFIHPNASATATVRSLLIIDPAKK
jgi:alkyl hydroperoxide reductase subunit AhpC